MGSLGTNIDFSADLSLALMLLQKLFAAVRLFPELYLRVAVVQVPGPLGLAHQLLGLHLQGGQLAGHVLVVREARTDLSITSSGCKYNDEVVNDIF